MRHLFASSILLAACAAKSSIDSEPEPVADAALPGVDATSPGCEATTEEGVAMAFPGAEGYGADTPGGRSATTQRLHVINLDDDGPGSLRAALTTPGPRLVLFDVSGTITLASDITIVDPYVTVAGQTAPGDGVQTRGAVVEVATHDVVVRGARFRIGDDYAQGPAPIARDSLRLGTLTGGDVSRIVVDHCSFAWGIDESVAIQDSHDVTFSYNVVAETLRNNEHPDGAHSRGFMVSAQSPGATYRVAVHHNLMMSNNERNPVVDQNSTGYVANNLVYNYGFRGTHVSLAADVVGNAYVGGPNTPRYGAGGPFREGIVANAACDPRTGACAEPVMWVAGNVTGGQPGRPSDSGDEWLATRCEPLDSAWCTGLAFRGVGPTVDDPDITIDPVDVAINAVLDRAGASPRDALDERLIAEARTGGTAGGFKDCVVTCDGADVDAGDWPVLAASPPAPDGDGDGIPDAWELVNCLDPSADDALTDGDGDGYLAIEEWFNSLIP